MRRMAAVVLVSACLWAGTCLWAQVPAGWRTIRSVSKPPATMAGPVVRDGKCSLAVPGNWIDDKTVDRSQAHSPDGTAQAFVQEWPSRPNTPTFASRKSQTLKDYQKQKADSARAYHQDVLELKVLEDSATRLEVVRVSTEPLGPGLTDWTLLAAGDPICYAVVHVSGTAPTAPPAAHATAQQLLPVVEKIVASFSPAK